MKYLRRNSPSPRSNHCVGETVEERREQRHTNHREILVDGSMGMKLKDCETFGLHLFWVGDG